MVTIDLNHDKHLDELFRRFEAGEVLRIVRGTEEILIVKPHSGEEAELDLWASAGLKAWAEMSPPEEFADWEKPDGAR